MIRFGDEFGTLYIRRWGRTEQVIATFA
jgi:hypothetical protein